MKGEAFEDAPLEIARILHKTAEDVEVGHTDGVLWDYNGQRVGTFSTLADEEEA